MLQRFEAIVVGLGAHGSACIYHLAKRGVNALGIEAQPSIAHSLGSSHGLSRIIRLAYQEHPDYVPLLRRAYDLWRNLEKDSGREILTITGCLDCSPANSSSSFTPHRHSCFDGSLAAAQQHKLPHEVLSAQEVNERFPGYRLPKGFQAVLQPDGGFVVPECGIEAHVELAQQHGAVIKCGTKVLWWEPAADLLATQGSSMPSMQGRPEEKGPSGISSNSGGGGGGGSGEAREGVLVHTQGPGGERASYWARRLVLAPGPWLDTLVPEMKGLLVVERQVVGWFEVDPNKASDFEPGRFPVFLLQDEQGYYYGFPADEHGFKIGKYHHRREVVGPETIDREVSADDEEVLRECVERYFPGAAGRLTRASACLFTNTPDEHFIVDLHPRHPQVVLCSACSGHGYKFAPIIGSLLADLALHGSTLPQAHFLRVHPGRPGHAAFLERCGAERVSND